MAIETTTNRGCRGLMQIDGGMIGLAKIAAAKA